MLDLGLYVFYVLLFVAVAAALIFPLINSIKEPKGFDKDWNRLSRRLSTIWDILWFIGFYFGPECHFIWSF